jgi:hypothetical protein
MGLIHDRSSAESRHSNSTPDQRHRELIDRMPVHRGRLSLWPRYVPYLDAVIFKQLSCGVARKRGRIVLRQQGGLADADCKERQQLSGNVIYYPHHSRPGIHRRTLLAFNFPNTGYDLVYLPNLAILECEPLDTANAIRLSAGREDSALPQQNSAAVTLKDDALYFGLLVSDQTKVSPGCGNNLIAAPPGSIEKTKPANVEFNVICDQFPKRLEVTLNDGVEGRVKNGLRVPNILCSGTARCKEKSIRVFAVHGDQSNTKCEDSLGQIYLPAPSTSEVHAPGTYQHSTHLSVPSHEFETLLCSGERGQDLST